MNNCKYFYSAFKEQGILINSGFNCKHPEQKSIHYEENKKIGCCDLLSCPLVENQCKLDDNDRKNMYNIQGW